MEASFIRIGEALDQALNYRELVNETSTAGTKLLVGGNGERQRHEANYFVEYPAA